MFNLTGVFIPTSAKIKGILIKAFHINTLFLKLKIDKMKIFNQKTMLLTILIIGIIAFVSCKNDNKTTKESSTDNRETTDKVEKPTISNEILEKDEYEFGYINSKTNEFVKLSDNELTNFYHNSQEISENISFQELKLIKVNDNGEEYFMTNQISENGKIKIGLKLEMQPNSRQLALTGETCKCESESCTLSGCEVVSMCSCSHCNGDCKKTHTITNEFYPELFQ